MDKFAELEIGLHRREVGSYALELRFSQPESDAEVRLGQGQSLQTKLDLNALQELMYDPEAYGRRLTQDLFLDPGVQNAFSQALANAQSLNLPLRVRLMIGASSPELHNLRWETLRNFQDGAPLTTDENLLFSRYLSSLDWRPVKLRPMGALRALTVIASPSDLAEYNLAPVDVGAELARVENGLGAIPMEPLATSSDGADHATLNRIIQALRGTEFDVLYLVCHGAMIKDEPWLWLEDEQGKVDRVSGEDLVLRLKELPQRPRLAMLASCQSAGKGEGDALSALGPRLAEAGIPAVIAMQGNISMQTVAEFMPVFFTELQRDGQIDRAMAVARGAVRDRPDYWMPALFMRLKSGRIWYVPGFGGDKDGFEKWPALLRSIKRGQCTPILGPGLFEPMLGSMRDIAQRWSESYHYPMAPHERESLPQVAQYLAINQYAQAPYDELEEYLENYIQERYQSDLPGDLQQGRAPLDQLVSVVGERFRDKREYDPYKILAHLPLPIYITTNPGDLMGDALREAGKEPKVILCPWNEYIEQRESLFDCEADYFPTPEEPLVYHLFGRLDEPDSLVITEDDYFDYLIGVTSNKDLIPSAVRRVLADSALLFLGFQMDEWNFRVLFRSILSQQGGGRRDRYAHIAAQIEPEEGRILEPARARRYLEKYFAKGADVSLFWGSAEDFLKELSARWNENAR